MKKRPAILDFLEGHRPGFLRLSRREKVLSVLFLVVIVVLWFGSFADRFGTTRRNFQTARADLGIQQQWFDERENIDLEYNEALATLDPSKLLPRNEVIAQFEALTKKFNLTPRIDPPQSEQRDRLTFHTVNVTFDRVEYGQLAKFHAETANALASVNLKSVRINQASRPPYPLTARFTYEVIEANR